MSSPVPWREEERRLLVFNYKDIYLLHSHVWVSFVLCLMEARLALSTIYS